MELLEASQLKAVHRSHKNHGEETNDQSVVSKSSEESQSDKEDFNNGTDDLQGLDDDSLISTLHSEVSFFLSFPDTLCSLLYF